MKSGVFTPSDHCAGGYSCGALETAGYVTQPVRWSRQHNGTGTGFACVHRHCHLPDGCRTGCEPIVPRVCGVIPLRVIPVKFLSVLRRIAFLMQPSGICMLACYGSMLNDAATRNRVHDAFKA